MSRRLILTRAVFAATICCSSLPVTAAQIQLATDAPQPLKPAESLTRFKLPPGLRIELVAAEPHVADPVAIAFDARGRIFVCEIHGYNLEGYLDVLELNKTGVLDKAVRRIEANPQALKQAAEQQYGTVKLLEDTDGDGRVDRCSVWADRLPPCYGVVEARDGVIVLCAPDIIYLADRDGDGQAEIRETLFTGFGLYDLWSRINNPRWGPDNWIYAANGINSGGTIRGPRLAGEVRLGATCFRFKPDGSAIEPVSGSAGGFGLALNDWGDRFLVTNQQHALFVAPLPHRYLARNPYYAAPNLVVNISTYGHPAKVYPTSQPDPWRLERSKDPAWVKFYGVAEATANGFFTAASGQAIYRADRWPAEYHGNHFSVDNAQNMVHRCLLEPTGASFTVRRPQADERTEFLTSTEQWFRPVNLEVGPDGALYVVDMYRSIIEDYSAIPRYLQQRYIESLIAGADLGRLWRIVPEGSPPAARPDLTRHSGEQLVGELSHPNAWFRLTAQRLLVERGAKQAVPPLVEVATRGAAPRGRLHALYTLDGLDSLTPEVVAAALDDEHFAVRLHALALSERWLSARPELVAKACQRADDEHPRVRLQAALTLGAVPGDAARRALARLADRFGDDPWMQAAILCSSAEAADGLLTGLLHSGPSATHGQSLLRPLASIIGARHRNDEIGRLLEAVLRLEGRQEARQAAALDGLSEGLRRGKAQMLTGDRGQQALRGLLASSSATVRQQALQVAKLVRLQEAPEMQAALTAAVQNALDESRPLADRVKAVAVLAGAPFDAVAPSAGKLLDPRQPVEVQLATLQALAAVEDQRVAGLLLADWPSKTPKVQTAALDALFQRQDRLPALLEALGRRAIPLSSLDTARREQLQQNPDTEIRRRAQTLLAGQTAGQDRAAIIARYAAALANPRHADHGRQVFEKQCAKCHRVREQGFAVGPDLASSIRRSDEMLVSDVLDPSDQITVGYNSYTVVTEEGRIFTGVLAAESATSVTLRREEGKEETILRKDIEQMAASPTSMMPEKLEQEVQPQDVADVIAYIRQAFGPELPPRVTLFDDDPGFVHLLKEGEGRAAVEMGDRHRGTMALRMSPPQRFALRIPGWEYRIAENPGPGEYRYLRFAWKSLGGHGVMIELAGDGKWPPADRPLWRYYAGQNTTGWAARQVSSDVPRDWVVVTCDLWKDFGPFTLTGIAPTALGGNALFDQIELLRRLEP